ncbi:ATP synthase subunit I [Natronospora cellulosivora (SeqCode)]
MIFDQDVNKVELLFIKRTFKIGLIPLAGSLLAGEFASFKGLLLALIISFFLFRLKKLNIIKALEKEADQARRFIIGNYIITYFIYFILLYNSYKNPDLDFIAVVIGLLLLKFTIIATVFLEEIKERFEKKFIKKSKEEGGVLD